MIVGSHWKDKTRDKYGFLCLGLNGIKKFQCDDLEKRNALLLKLRASCQRYSKHCKKFKCSYSGKTIYITRTV